MKNSIEKLANLPAKYGEFADEHPYIATIAETAALHGLRRVANAVSKKRGIKTGNALSEEYLDVAAENPLKSVALMTLVGPVGEEVIARIIPGEVSKRLEDRHETLAKGIKAASLLGFAAIHSGIVRPKEGSKKPSINTDLSKMSVPVSQLAGALNYKRLYDKRGPGHNVVAHITNNTLGAIGSARKVYNRRQELKQRQS